MISRLRNYFIVAFKGLCVGGSMAVPGVSGGSMAMILGIYDKLITAVGSFRKDIKRHTIFLGFFCLGSFLGLWLFAQPLATLLKMYPMPTKYFFMGAVAGGLPLMFKSAKIDRFSLKVMIYPIIGFAFIYLLSLLPTGCFTAGTKHGLVLWLMLIVAGFISAAALVLPGISVSYMLLLLGMYEETMNAIHDFNITYLIPLGIGLLIGIFLTTKLLENAMENHSQPTYLIIIGFVIASLLELAPGIPSGFNIAISLLTFGVGAVSIWAISKTA